jgi:uncharacterized protein (DUF1684 family)
MKKYTLLQSTTVFLILFIFLFHSFTGCTKSTSTIDPAVHKKEIEDWQANRLKRLTSERGWLTLVGLFWLNDGENTFGSDSSNAVIFPEGTAPKFAGSLLLNNGIVEMKAQPGVDIRYNDSTVSSIMMADDSNPKIEPTILKLGTVTIQVIERAGKLGIRMKDSESDLRKHFKGLEYFPTDMKWRITATFEPYTPQKILKIPTMIGTVEENPCPGALVFDIDGKQHRIDAVIETGSEHQLFIMFSDETSGKETYAVGRQLYTSLPDSNNNVILDFNKAYNWPCVFTEYATCPIPPRQNHIPVRVEAGEKMYAGH